METKQNLNERRLADAWAELQTHANEGNPLHADAYRLAFADPEFLLRRETRGIRFQLEMLKPDLAQRDAGIENTVVVFGSARFREASEAQEMLVRAERSGEAADIARAKAIFAKHARCHAKAASHLQRGGSPICLRARLAVSLRFGIFAKQNTHLAVGAQPARRIKSDKPCLTCGSIIGAHAGPAGRAIAQIQPRARAQSGIVIADVTRHSCACKHADIAVIALCVYRAVKKQIIAVIPHCRCGVGV